KKNLSIRRISVFFFKLFIHILMYAIFIKGFSIHYLVLRFFSRTLAVSTSAYLVFTSWLTSVYGKIEIGIKKSRPLFHTLVLNLLITNVLAVLTLKVMKFHNHFSLSSYILMLGMVYDIQFILRRILNFVANSLYFTNYVPK